MIEVSERKYWKELNYEDGLLYCQLLEVDGKNDWRMIKDEDEYEYCYDIKQRSIKLPYGWFIDDCSYVDIEDTTLDNWVVPVREV